MKPGIFLAASLLAVCAGVEHASAQSYTTLASFDGTNGAGPTASLVQSLDGNFYGATLTGGANRYGTVFRVTPAGTLTMLHSFKGADGDNPAGSLALDTDGALFGTTETGGQTNLGTVFTITPAGTFNSLYSFCTEAGCPDGSVPAAGLVRTFDGGFWGTTFLGSNEGGSVFRMTPGAQLSTVYTFCPPAHCALGANPSAALVQSTDGNFYGTTEYGGFPPLDGAGGGTVFRITPQGEFDRLYGFCADSAACPDGQTPTGGVVEGADGSFYGTTVYGGATSFGTVFNLTTSGALTTLYNFCSQSGCTDGANPYAGLTIGTDGNLYGTTSSGGANNRGTIFEITPTGQFTVLYSFCAQSGCPDGEAPYGGLLQGTDGNFYGVTYLGGAHGQGAIFKLSMGLGPFVSLLPVAGSVGTQVKILGTNLTGATSVSFNGIAATFTVNSRGTAISTTVPAGATIGTIQVVTPGGTLSSNVAFQVLQ